MYAFFTKIKMYCILIQASCALYTHDSLSNHNFFFGIFCTVCITTCVGVLS